MNGIVIDIDPVIAHIGPLTLRWYGLFFALAVVAGIWLALREARRKGLDVDRIQSLATWAIIGGLVGARLFHVIDSWEVYAANPQRLLNVWEGGLAVYGGLIGGVVTGLVYARRHKLPPWKVADAAAPGMILGQAVGRLACIPNGDAFGAPTTVPWAFVYTNPQAMVPRTLLNVPTHPYAVYELLFDLALLGVLWRLRRVFQRDGVLFLFYAAVYMVGRFVLTFYRAEQIALWGLQQAQVIALLALPVVLVLLVWRLRTGAGPTNGGGGARDPQTQRTHEPLRQTTGVSR